jgi:hypothetical protein
VRVPAHSSREAASSRSTKGARRGGGSRRPAQTNIAIVPVGTAAPMRASEARRPSKSRRPSRARERAYEAPLLTAGGVTLLLTGVVMGDLLADVVDRYLAGVDPAASPAPTLPAPYTVDNPIPKYNNDSQAMQPGVWRIVAQLIPGVLFLLLGGVSKSAALKVFLYGFGGGFITHLGTQIVTAYIIVPMVKGSTGTGARLYQHEINVYNGLANPSGGILGAGLLMPARNKPRGMGAPPAQLPQNQPANRVPISLAAAASPAAAPVAAAATAAAAPAAPAQTMGQPPAAHQAGCGCATCKPATAAAPVGQLGQGGEWGEVWMTLVGRKAA